MMSDSNSVKIAIVGCGAITKSQHLPSVLRSPNAELHSLVDTNVELAEDLAHKFAITSVKINDNLSQVINDVDGVIIATPNHTHFPIAELALSHGVPVLIEKPITTTYADAVKLCEIAEKKDTFISVGYKTRHYPNVALMKNLLQRKFFGKISNFHYEFGSKGGWAPVSGYNISREMSGGGVMVVTGTHFLDRMLYWFGEPAEFTFEDDSFGGVEANCKADFKFQNGGETFTGSIYFSKTIPLRNKFVMKSDKYFCEIDESKTESITIIPKDNPDVAMEVFHNSNGRGKELNYYVQQQLEEFVSNIRKFEGVSVDGRFAALSLKLIEKMYQNRRQLNEAWLDFSNKDNK